MLRVAASVLLVSAVALAGSAVPELTNSGTQPELRDFPDHPEKANPPAITECSDNHPDYEHSGGSHASFLRQELPSETTIELQTADLCDSDDMVGYTLTIPDTSLEK